MDARPIGIFDSGLGGLTAAKVLEEIMPEENIIYFGDSVNAPYGTRDREDLIRLARANTAFLQSFDCKAVLVACGTVSTNAMDVLRAEFDVPFFDMLEAACRTAVQRTRTGRIAVIATEATIRKDAFARRLKQLDANVECFSKACQSLVTVAEQGHFAAGDEIGAAAVAQELEPVKAWGPDVLIMACTHFPLLQEHIAACLGNGVTLLSVGAESAQALKAKLTEQDQLAPHAEGGRRWFTSGDPAEFSANAAMFLGHTVQAERKEDNR